MGVIVVKLITAACGICTAISGFMVYTEGFDGLLDINAENRREKAITDIEMLTTNLKNRRTDKTENEADD